MKTNLFKLMSAAMTIFAVATVFTSCCKDDDDDGKKVQQPFEINLDNVGTFKLKNLTTGELIEENVTSYVLYGDSLKMDFIPNEKYSQYAFNVSFFIIDQFSKPREISNTYVRDANDSKIVMKAYYDLTSNDTIYHLSALREYVLVWPDQLSIINYRFAVTPDLLLFITPEISYSDDKGLEYTIQLSEDMMTQQHFVNDKMGIDYYDYWWDKEMRYFKWDIDCGMSVKFISKENVTMTKEAYDLDTALLAPSGQSNGTSYSWTNISINITIGKEKKDNDGRILKEYVQEYIDKLVSTPHKIRFHIDSKGHIDQIKE